MNLTLPSPDILPDGSPHFFNAVSVSFVPGGFAKKEIFNYPIRPAKCVASRQKQFYGLNQSRFISSISQKNISLFPGLNFNTSINVAEFDDCCQSASQNDARRIFFRTRPFKTSDELLSMATGLCSVRVKNKATSEATLLQYVKI